MADLIVLLGAALRPDGGPSGAMLRRLTKARRLADEYPEAMIFCSGAAARGGPSEAAVMGAWLTAAGVGASRLVLDHESRDTFQTAVAAARFAREAGAREVLACTCSFHAPRTRMIFALLGTNVREASAPATLRAMGVAKGLQMRLREAAAIPYDAVVTLVRRRRLMR